MDLVRTLLDWIDIPSVTGAEGDYGDALARELAAIGLAVEKQELGPGRFNVLARGGDPRVVLCTHQDTVRPGSRRATTAISSTAGGPATRRDRRSR